jgi:hypothetical protein
MLQTVAKRQQEYGASLNCPCLAYSSTVGYVPISASETSVNFYQTTRCHVPKTAAFMLTVATALRSSYFISLQSNRVKVIFVRSLPSTLCKSRRSDKCRFVFEIASGGNEKTDAECKNMLHERGETSLKVHSWAQEIPIEINK